MDFELNPGPVISPRFAHYFSLSRADYSAKLSHTDVTNGNISSVSPVHRFVYVTLHTARYDTPARYWHDTFSAYKNIVVYIWLTR